MHRSGRKDAGEEGLSSKRSVREYSSAIKGVSRSGGKPTTIPSGAPHCGAGRRIDASHRGDAMTQADWLENDLPDKKSKIKRPRKDSSFGGQIKSAVEERSQSKRPRLASFSSSSSSSPASSPPRASRPEIIDAVAERGEVEKPPAGRPAPQSQVGGNSPRLKVKVRICGRTLLIPMTAEGTVGHLAEEVGKRYAEAEKTGKNLLKL